MGILLNSSFDKLLEISRLKTCLDLGPKIHLWTSGHWSPWTSIYGYS